MPPWKQNGEGPLKRYRENLVGGFTVELVPRRRIVHAVMTGLFEASDAAGMMHAYVQLLGNVGFAPSTFDLLVDVSGAPIQSGEIVQTLSNFVSGRHQKPGRIAFVHGDNAIRIQARRVSAEQAGRHFTMVEDAMRWLDEDMT